MSSVFTPPGFLGFVAFTQKVGLGRTVTLAPATPWDKREHERSVDDVKLAAGTILNMNEQAEERRGTEWFRGSFWSSRSLITLDFIWCSVHTHIYNTYYLWIQNNITWRLIQVCRMWFHPDPSRCTENEDMAGVILCSRPPCYAAPQGGQRHETASATRLTCKCMFFVEHIKITVFSMHFHCFSSCFVGLLDDLPRKPRVIEISKHNKLVGFN